MIRVAEVVSLNSDMFETKKITKGVLKFSVEEEVFCFKVK